MYVATTSTSPRQRRGSPTAFYNTGQSCCSVERIYVHEKIHDAFVEAVEVKGYRMAIQPTRVRDRADHLQAAADVWRAGGR